MKRHKEEGVQCHHCPAKFSTAINRQRHENLMHPTATTSSASTATTTTAATADFAPSGPTAAGNGDAEEDAATQKATAVSPPISAPPNFTSLQQCLNGKFVCRDCGTSFSLESQLKKHEKLRKDICAKVFYCKVCQRGFSERYNRNRHEAVHRYGHDLKFKCQKCFSSFVNQSGLEAHNKTHGLTDSWSGVPTKLKKKIPPPTTGSATGSSSSSNVDRRVFNGAKSALNGAAPIDGRRKPSSDPRDKCDFCGARFQSVKEWKLPQCECSKPFQCGECGKRLANQAALSTHSFKHKKTGTKAVRIFCQHCQRQFSSLKYLMPHIRKFHPKVVADDF